VTKRAETAFGRADLESDEHLHDYALRSSMASDQCII
jgi:hypothetical protein